MTSLPLEANAAATLAEWHGLIARRDLSGLPRLLHPDAVFRPSRETRRRMDISAYW
ncbi:hypothetical protein ACLBT1_30160, partial [Pseudomonas aeruginosa]